MDRKVVAQNKQIVFIFHDMSGHDGFSCGKVFTIIGTRLLSIFYIYFVTDSGIEPSDRERKKKMPFE